MKRRRLAIIPARGGSKRIPRKNVRPFLGRPMILRVLDEISNEEIFDAIHVSTEDEEILQLVSEAGYAPSFTRPESLADDYTPLSAVMQSVVESYKQRGELFDTIVLIYATAALLEREVLNQALAQFEALESGVQMISVASFPVPVEWAMRMEDNGSLQPVSPKGLAMRSQDLQEAWYETAEFVIYDEASIWNQGAGTIRIGFPIPYLTVDIDTEEDWIRAERIADAKR